VLEHRFVEKKSDKYIYIYITRKNAIVECLDYQIPVTQLKGSKENGDMQAAKRNLNTPPTGGRQI